MALSASSNKKITVVIDIEYGINSITYYTLTMLPKIIHYCWFGRNPLPELAIKCIESWRKFLPEYEIRAWNEDNFNVNLFPILLKRIERRNIHLLVTSCDFGYYIDMVGYTLIPMSR